MKEIEETCKKYNINIGIQELKKERAKNAKKEECKRRLTTVI